MSDDELSHEIHVTTISKPPDEANLLRDDILEPHSHVVTTRTYSHSGPVHPKITKNGTLQITSASISPRKTRLLKKTTTFEARISVFDRLNPLHSRDTFRGFHTLFWILMATWVFRTFADSYASTGSFLGLTFGKLIGKDGLVLALSDLVLIFSSFLCVPFSQMVDRGWISYPYFALVLQHTAQTIYLFTAIRWTFFRDWYWVQSGFLTLHSLTMLMKIHSYVSTNGALSQRRRLYIKVRKTIDDLLLQETGGRNAALNEARLLATSDEEDSALLTSPTTETPPQSLQTGQLRRRKSSKESRKRPHLGADPSGNPLSSTTQPAVLDTDLHILCFHPNSIISENAIKAADLLDDLTSTGPAKIQYPANLTYANFWDFLLIPSLVYELEYPRTPSVRWSYVLEKTLATAGTFSLIYVITEHYILPITQKEHSSFLSMGLDLATPFMLNYLLIFYISTFAVCTALGLILAVFECICNGFAELSRFADRQFYEDWWNACTFEDYSRSWNKPVHHWLLRHVYTSFRTSYKTSRFQAAFITFLLSACVHELVMIVVTKKLRMYLFGMQMAQLPLIVAGRLPWIRKNPALGNVFFWLGLLSGFPLLAVGYLRF